MWYLLQKLIFGHVHTWKIIDRCSFERRYHPTDGGGLAGTGERLTLQCEVCGDVKKRDII